ncbi:serine hydrolase domain-containing protein [Nocardia sp. NPDC003693]
MTSMPRMLRAAAGALAVACALTACGTSTDSEAPQILSDSARAEVRRVLDAVIAAGTAGVQVVVTEDGRDWQATAGVGDVGTGAGFPTDARVRAGSNTKAFAATVIMQLVTAGSVHLDAPVERYLPGLVWGEGIDGNRITVRNLMQHTSGLPEYLELPELQQDYADLLDKRFDAADLVLDAVRTMPAHFPPGEKAEYSNTNYLILGLLIERVTGRTFAEEVAARVATPLGLRGTYIPAPGELGLRDPHPLGYEVVDGRRTDMTRYDPAFAGAAGALVSTGAELNRFFTALLGGALIEPARVIEMQRDPRPLTNRPAGIDYGLGIALLTVPCETRVWGHGGSIPGFRTYDGVTADGRAVSVLANERPADPAAAAALQSVFDTAICADR